MREVQIMKRPKSGENGKYRLAVIKDCQGGRTDIFADALPPETGVVLDTVANVAVSWNWRRTDAGVVAEGGCPAEVVAVLANAVQGTRY